MLCSPILTRAACILALASGFAQAAALVVAPAPATQQRARVTVVGGAIDVAVDGVGVDAHVVVEAVSGAFADVGLAGGDVVVDVDGVAADGVGVVLAALVDGDAHVARVARGDNILLLPLPAR